ncbi:sigma-70 family RNA polymerase sigma factor [Candidatus Dojkabacteria bacterium]|nr:sigma-70 family RNA polymerase sigma factor [Candidatus Dojkabacteria bacterium]
MINKDIEKEKKLVRRAQKNRKHFGDLYVIYKDKVESFILKKVSDREIAEDLTSKVFEKAMTKISQFKWKGVSFGCWIFRIARNTVYDYYRSDKKDKRTSLKEEIGTEKMAVSDLEEDVLHNEREKELFNIIASFESEDQYLLYFKYFERLSNRDISERMGLSESNVATKLHRIRRKMKTVLE